MRAIALTLTLLLLTSSAFAKSITVTFGYPEESHSAIIGFRLLRDGVVDFDNIPVWVRSFICAAADDSKDHIYKIVAIAKDGTNVESLPYTLKYTVPVVKKPTSVSVK